MLDLPHRGVPAFGARSAEDWLAVIGAVERLLGEPAVAGAADTAAALSLPAAVTAFDARVRPGIVRLVAASSRLEDLAQSFPALLFALATGYGARQAQIDALRAIDRGAPLHAIADRIGLPLWTRKLPAQAFGEPLQGLPIDAEFGRRITPFLPAAQKARAWLASVQSAVRACHADYAIWIASWAARYGHPDAPVQTLSPFHLLAAWAWHGDQPGTQGHRLLRRRWSPEMGHRRAIDELALWRQRTALVGQVDGRRDETAPADGRALGYEFAALLTAEAFIAEAEVMDNCLDSFAGRLTEGYSRVYSVRRDGQPVADLEIGLHAEDATMPAILQLRGRANQFVAPEVWQAAYGWLASAPLKRIVPANPRLRSHQAARALQDFWRPYLSHIDGTPEAAWLRQATPGLRALGRSATQAAARPRHGKEPACPVVGSECTTSSGKRI